MSKNLSQGLAKARAALTEHDKPTWCEKPALPWPEHLRNVLAYIDEKERTDAEALALVLARFDVQNKDLARISEKLNEIVTKRGLK